MHEDSETTSRKKTLQERISAAQIAAQHEAEKGLKSPRLARSFLYLTRPLKVPLRRSLRFTALIQSMFSKTEQDAQVIITGAHLVVVLLLGVIFTIRVTAWDFNTLHLDEAIYTTVGEDTLSGVFEQGAVQWMFGSYFYPILAALVNNIGGVFGLRLFSAVLTTIAAMFVYLITLRLFNVQAALWALLAFGLTGVSINLGQLAVLDTLGVPLLAVTLYCAIRAVQTPERQQSSLEWAGIAFSLCILAKYIGLFLLPAVIMTMFALHLSYGRSPLTFFSGISWQSLILPMLIILGIYGALYGDELKIVLTGQFADQPESRLTILKTIFTEIGLPLVLALTGLSWDIRKAVRRTRYRKWVIAVFVLLLLTALFALPLYHLLIGNIRSLWKHNVYTLVFLAPLAGYSITLLIQSLRSRAGEHRQLIRGAGAVITVGAVLWFLSSAVWQNNEFRKSWPNNRRVIADLRTLDLTPQSRVLSSSYAIYEYYFDFGAHDRETWANIWYEEYGGLKNREGVEKAIAECAYDVAVLDNYYAPEWSDAIQRQLLEAGYTLAFSESERLATDADIVTNVYLPPEEGCAGGSG
jgi:4-amino-4-deoxy-L-arabinose transferase-like glycosyltransferase